MNKETADLCFTTLWGCSLLIAFAGGYRVGAKEYDAKDVPTAIAAVLFLLVAVVTFVVGLTFIFKALGGVTP